MDKRICGKPEAWTIITALDAVIFQAKDSGLKEEFWESCQGPLAHLTRQLGLSGMQVVFLAMLIEAGEPLSMRKFGKFLGCSRLSMMAHTEELEELIARGWIIRKTGREMGVAIEGYALVKGVAKALCHNRCFVPEQIDGLSEQAFVDRLESHVSKNMHDRSIEFSDDEAWMVRLCEANPDLPLCREVLAIGDIHARSLLLMVVIDYARWADSDGEGLDIDAINDIYPEEWECDFLRSHLSDGTHVLIERGLIEYTCEDGIVNNQKYRLTQKAKSQLLSAYKPSRTMLRKTDTGNLGVRRHASIREKVLYFNPAEQQQVDRLASLLSRDNLPSIQQRLAEQGLRRGFACLFYGDPGTGKTETVLQIARRTGRDIMQIDIAGLRDKWVGESEKNIKAVFSQYRDLCGKSDVMPILFFNEADGIFGKRTEHVERAVDKMDNAMQNIILQEIEDLDGILIATTNLTQNLDAAFERRFLFKVQFRKPTADVKAKIWHSMMPNISQEDAAELASKYDFSGGQIENVARKRTIDFILSGEYAGREGIETYCQTELLEDGRKRRAVVGFGM